MSCKVREKKDGEENKTHFLHAQCGLINIFLIAVVIGKKAAHLSISFKREDASMFSAGSIPQTVALVS